MPLIKSGSDAARQQNIRTLMGEVGKSPHVQSREQALAIAYETQRRAGRAEGGPVGGLVDHNRDPDLPPAQDPVRLEPMMPMPQGYQDPAYIATIQRLMEGQRRLNAMHPMQRDMLRRFWLGGLAYWMGGYVK
jgi:hypothetical protein